MLATLKIIHLLALAVGLGGGVANAVLGAMAARQHPAIILPIQKRLGRVSFGALVLLWITGVTLVLNGPWLGTLGLWFWLKMIAVVAMTLAALAVQIAPLRLPREKLPALAKRLGMAITACATLAVIFAVLAFA